MSLLRQCCVILPAVRKTAIGAGRCVQPALWQSAQPTLWQTRTRLLPPELCVSWSILARNYAKKRDSKGGKHGVHKVKVQLSDEELQPVLDINKYRTALQKVVDGLKEDYIHNLSLRTSTASFDRLQVKTNDGVFPLNHIASIVMKNPTLLIIHLSQSSQYIAEVMDTLRNSGMNLNPQQEGSNTIFITIPKVSREHREGLAKSAKTMFNTTKDKLHKVFDSDARTIKKVKKAGNISEDLIRNAEAMILDEMHSKVAQAEELMKMKQKELLGNH